MREAGGRLYAGLVYADGPGGDDFLVERAKVLGALGADRVLLHDQAGSLDAAGVGDLVTRLREAAGVPVGLYVQGPGGTALAVAVEAARAGADPIAAAAYPVAVPTHRASSELLAQTLDGIGFDSGIDQFAAWEAALLVDQALGAGESLPPPLSAHVSLLRRRQSRARRPRRERRAAPGRDRRVRTACRRCWRRSAASATSSDARRSRRPSG